MRVSVDTENPGFANLVRGTNVFFEGYERSHVFTADEEKRLIVAALLDAHGRIQLNPSRTAVLRETLYGHVRIELPPLHSRPMDDSVNLNTRGAGTDHPR